MKFYDSYFLLPEGTDTYVFSVVVPIYLVEESRLLAIDGKYNTIGNYEFVITYHCWVFSFYLE